MAIGGVILAYLLAPWREQDCERIYHQVSQAKTIINNYKEILKHFRSRNYDQGMINKLDSIIKDYMYE